MLHRLNVIASQKSGVGLAELFNTVGRMLKDSFEFARSVGVKTCLGNEAPVALPKTSNRSGTPLELYTGIFGRIAAAGIPIVRAIAGSTSCVPRLTMPPQDYYWLWTGEGWGARGDAAKNASQQPHVANSTSPVVQTVLADMLAADAAKKATGANFSLATCGTLDSHSDGYVADPW